MSRRFSTSRQGRLTLDLSDLRTVRYIQAQPVVRKAWNNTTTNYAKGKQLPAVGILFVWFEMYSSWIWRTVHAIPFPEFVVSLIYQMDDRAEHVLDYTVNQAEWWWDKNSIRLMWLQESLEIRSKHLVELINKITGRYKEFVLWYLSTINMLVKWSIALYTAPITTSKNTWIQVKEFLKLYKTKGISSNNKQMLQQQQKQQQQQGHQHHQQFVDTDDEVELRKTDNAAKRGSLRRLFQKSDKGSGSNAAVNGYPSGGDEQPPISPTNGHRSSSLKRFPRIFTSSYKNKEGDQSSDEVSAYGESPVSSTPGSPEPSQKPYRSSSFFGTRKSATTSGNPKHPTESVIEGSRRTFSWKGQRSRK